MRYRHIIWDWNGTLVNDAELTVELTNIVLSTVGSRAISLEEHRSVFEIPIINYYRAIGVPITPETMASVDNAFHQSYDEARHRLALFSDIGPTLSTLKEHACESSILSALPQKLLVEHLDHLNLSSDFKYAIGRETTHAESKVEAGHKLLKKLNVAAADVLIIGDTLYDHDVAMALGADCALVARGHQSAARLEAVKPTYLAHSVAELLERLQK